MKWRILGGRTHEGELTIAGFKHAVIPMIAMSTLCDGPIELDNVPRVLDTAILVRILTGLGAAVELGETTLRIDARRMHYGPVPSELSGQVHGAVYLIPTLLARFGQVEFGEAGGCQIGALSEGGKRPIRHMLSVLERFGATFELEGERIRGRCGRLRACEIDIMDYSSDPARRALTGPLHSGATKTALIAAAVAEGTTVIKNPLEREVSADLMVFLRAAGCNVAVEDRRYIVEGRGGPLGGARHSIISDTTEMTTFIAQAVYANTPLLLTNVTVESVQRPSRWEFRAFEAMGVRLEWGSSSLRVRPPDVVRGIDVEATGMGISTDCQPFITLMLMAADRPSRLVDGIWSQRFQYVAELVKLGARLDVEGPSVRITPGRAYIPDQTIRANDTRAAAVLALAALGIQGQTVVEDVHHADRGYQDFTSKLRRIGAVIDEIQIA